MSEAGDFSPAHWGGSGHNFNSAYRDFDAHAGRSYTKAKAAGKKRKDLLPAELKTDSDAPFVIVTDQTGSMGEWPKVIFSKLPYLELEGQVYLGKDMEISWCAMGDAHNYEDYPVQARPFTKGTKLKKRLKELVLEGNGGGGGHESYELMALYLARCVHMPKAIRKPVCIFIGDEIPYDAVSKEMAKDYAGVNIEKRMSTADIFAELCAHFSVYIIRKPYNDSSGDSMSDFDREATAKWAKLLGGIDRVAFLPQPERVVDVIFGILAKETGQIEYFKEELEQRQLPDSGGKKKVDTVYKSLKTVHKLPKPGEKDDKKPSGKSSTRGMGSGKSSKSLM